MSKYIDSYTIQPDELIGGTTVSLVTANITLKGATGTLKRGTLLAENAGKYEVVNSASEIPSVKVAKAVLTEDVTLTGTDAVATVYTAGVFNADKLTVAEGDAGVWPHAEELRSVNIILTKLH